MSYSLFLNGVGVDLEDFKEKYVVDTSLAGVAPAIQDSDDSSSPPKESNHATFHCKAELDSKITYQILEMAKPYREMTKVIHTSEGYTATLLPSWV